LSSLLLLLLLQWQRQGGIALEQMMRLSGVDCALFIVYRRRRYGAKRRARHLAQQTQQHPRV